MSDRLPDWTVEIGFTGSLANLLVFPFSFQNVGGTVQTLGVFGSPFSQFYDGQYDDVSAQVEEITITRGRDDLLDNMAAGQATITLVDPPGQFGYFNPEDTTSPLASEVPGFKPMRPIRIRATLGGTVYPVYEGFLRSAEYRRESPNVGRCTVTALDLFMWLSRVRPRDAEFLSGAISSANINTEGDEAVQQSLSDVEATSVSSTGIVSTRSTFA